MILSGIIPVSRLTFWFWYNVFASKLQLEVCAWWYILEVNLSGCLYRTNHIYPACLYTAYALSESEQIKSSAVSAVCLSLCFDSIEQWSTFNSLIQKYQEVSICHHRRELGSDIFTLSVIHWKRSEKSSVLLYSNVYVIWFVIGATSTKMTT